MMIDRETVTLETLSMMFDVKLNTLRKEASQRKFPLIKKGRRILVDPRLYREYLDKGKVEPREAS
jgi:hypothetical protein